MACSVTTKLTQTRAPLWRPRSHANVHYKLLVREYLSGPASLLMHQNLTIYQSVVPAYTENGVDTPAGYLRKFTPDGLNLIAFSLDQRCVQIYKFLGTPEAQKLYKADESTAGSEKAHILFSKVFKLIHNVEIETENELLHRECMIFSANCKFLIVAAFYPIQDYVPNNFYEIFHNNESLSSNQRYILENSTIFVINIKTGRITDKQHFVQDRINYLHNQGLSLYGNHLAVLSIQHQTVHFYELCENGTLVKLLEVGRFCQLGDKDMFEEAHMTQSKSYSYNSEAHAVYHPYRERVFNSLKHMLLVHLFQEAKRLEAAGHADSMEKFFYRFNYLRGIRIWRMQLLNSDTLLLKFASEDVVTMKTQDMLSSPALFVIYSLTESKILQTFENTSQMFLSVYEDCMDYFRQVAVNPEPFASYSTSPGNSIYAEALHKKTKNMIIHARHGGILEAVRRGLIPLPYGSQNWSTSPYFDLNLFSYDDKWISPIERPKASPEAPIKFYSRLGNTPAFSLQVKHSTSGQNHRAVSAYIFHPFEPFIISIQRRGLDFFVSFHFRNIHRQL